MTTPERGRDGLREAVLTRGERETLESYLVALWQCKTERGYNEFVSRVLDYAAQIKTAGALIAVDDILAEHPATGDEAAGIRGVLHHIQRLDENGVRRDFTPPASDVDSDNAAAGGAEGLADSVYRTGLVNLPLADSLDVDCHDVARAVLASDWLAAHDAKARADERERIAQAIQRAKPPHLTRDYTPVDAAYDTDLRKGSTRGSDEGEEHPMTADNPAARVDLDALAGLLAECDDPPGWTTLNDDDDALVYECSCGDQSPALAHEYILAESVEAAVDWHRRHIASAIADRLAPLLAELRDAREALVSVESERDRWTQEALEYREDYARNRAERDEARAERDALRERVEAMADEPYYGAVMSNERYAEGFHDGWRIAMDHLRAALADPEAS